MHCDKIILALIIKITSHHHLRDILDEREIAEPPDLTETEPLDDIMSISLGALLGRSMLFSLRKSSIRGPRSGKSSPKFLN